MPKQVEQEVEELVEEFLTIQSGWFYPAPSCSLRISRDEAFTYLCKEFNRRQRSRGIHVADIQVRYRYELSYLEYKFIEWIRDTDRFRHCFDEDGVRILDEAVARGKSAAEGFVKAFPQVPQAEVKEFEEV